VVSTWTLDRARRGIEKLSHARLDWPAFSGEVARQLQRSVGFDGWCFSQADPATLLPARAMTSDSPATASQQRFWQIEYQLPDVNKLASLARTSQPVGALSAATSGDLARSRRWDEILRPAGIADELRAALTIGRHCWGSLNLYRASATRTYTMDDVQHLRHVAGAVAAGARGAWTAKTPPSDTGPAAGPGTIIVTAAGTPLTATPEATQWLAKLSPDPQGSHGTAIIYAITALLTAPARDTNAAAAARVRTRTTDGYWLDIHASPLAAALPGCDIAITVQAAVPSRISPLLMQAHSLSARERQIARLILDGRTLTEIARTLHISLYTAKDHLKAIFRKTGTHSRPELTKCLTGHLC
jgi:DNA-binding CsgD family transcriptional regulator